VLASVDFFISVFVDQDISLLVNIAVAEFFVASLVLSTLPSPTSHFTIPVGLFISGLVSVLLVRVSVLDAVIYQASFVRSDTLSQDCNELSANHREVFTAVSKWSVPTFPNSKVFPLLRLSTVFVPAPADTILPPFLINTL
jgi:hypothetical protein